MKTVLAILFALLLVYAAEATDRLFPDIHSSSKSGRYRIDATSPDNKKPGYHPFQDEFTYECIDTTSGDIVWKREQPMTTFKDGSEFPVEGSPVDVWVSNTGSTVIYTGSEELIIVALNGQVVRKIDFLEEALNKSERSKYVHETTAGPMWTGLSIWYFIEQSSGEFFVVRPWWGQRKFLNLSNGRLVQESNNLIKASIESEQHFVLEQLKSKSTTEDEHFEKYLPVYLAGVLNIKETIPQLREVEKLSFVGTSASGGLSWGTEFDNQVDPHNYETYSMRQVAQLSLRRLGETPKALPCHSFKLFVEGSSVPFEAALLKGKRHEFASQIVVGMEAKEILNLIGSPDFVSYDTWSYDMDAEKPFTLDLTMDARGVTGVKHREPIWKHRLNRDELLAN